MHGKKFIFGPTRLKIYLRLAVSIGFEREYLIFIIHFHIIVIVYVFILYVVSILINFFNFK